MECERVREEFIDRLTGGIDPDRGREIDAHLASCTACRAETDRLRAIWEELGALRPAATSGGAGRRVERLLDTRSRATTSSAAIVAGTTRTSLMPRGAFGATVVAASLLIGLLVGRRSATPARETREPAVASSATGTPTKEQYLLLLEGPARTQPPDAAPTSADSAAMRAIVAEYRAWAGRLRSSGALVLAEKLADEPIVVHARDGVVRPVRNSADEVGGFFLIQVADSAEAERIVRECPHLKYGGTVQLRKIQPT